MSLLKLHSDFLFGEKTKHVKTRTTMYNYDGFIGEKTVQYNPTYFVDVKIINRNCVSFFGIGPKILVHMCTYIWRVVQKLYSLRLLFSLFLSYCLDRHVVDVLLGYRLFKYFIFEILLKTINCNFWFFVSFNFVVCFFFV